MNRSRFTALLLAIDMCVALFSFWAAYWLRYQSDALAHAPEHPGSFLQISYGAFLAMGLWMLLALLFGPQRPVSGLNHPLEVSFLTTPYLFFVISYMAVAYADKILFSRLQLGAFFVVFYVLLLTARGLFRYFLHSLRYYGIGLRRVAIVGDSELGVELAQRIERHPELHYEVAGFLAPAGGAAVRQDLHQGLVGSTEFITQELASKGVNELIFVIPIRKDSETLDFIASCQRQGITIKMVPEYYEMHSQQIESLSIDGIPILELKDLSPDPALRMLKRLMDVFTSAALLLILSPLMFFIGLLLRLGGIRKIFKSERRIGLLGKPFQMYRFNVDFESGSEGDYTNWPLRFCKLLQRYSLSELPQLRNVLKGEMSLVGPRPENPERVRHYSVWHKRRLLLTPGITGLAQVRGLRARDSSDEKTRYDLEYAANFSPFFDVRLLLATLGTLARRRGKDSPPKASLPDITLSGRLGEKRS